MSTHSICFIVKKKRVYVGNPIILRYVSHGMFTEWGIKVLFLSTFFINLLFKQKQIK